MTASDTHKGEGAPSVESNLSPAWRACYGGPRMNELRICSVLKRKHLYSVFPVKQWLHCHRVSGRWGKFPNDKSLELPPLTVPLINSKEWVGICGNFQGMIPRWAQQRLVRSWGELQAAMILNPTHRTLGSFLPKLSITPKHRFAMLTFDIARTRAGGGRAELETAEHPKHLCVALQWGPQFPASLPPDCGSKPRSVLQPQFLQI